MENFEIQTLQETGRVVEKMADFAGSVVLQLMQKQGYVEKQGIKALLDHIREGGGTLTTVVSEQRAEDFKELMKKEHIPYVEIEHADPNTKEKSIFFVYRDCDRMGVKEVLKQFEITLDLSCHEVDLETFIAMRDKKSYGTVGNLTKAEVYAFREAAKGFAFEYCVVADGEKYAIVGSDAKALSCAASDMCYNLSGNLGREYEIALQNYFLQQKELVEQMKPEPGKVKYIVNKNNPANFISVDEKGITTHSVGRRPERGADGVVRDIIYDSYHQTYEGYDKEKLKQLVKELHNPIILSAESFPLVKEITKDGEAIVSQNFVRRYKDFVQAMEERKPDIQRFPQRRPKYRRENIIALSNVPRKVINALMQTEIPEVYVYGYDVAYPKELAERMDAFLEEHLYQNMAPEKKVKLQEEMSIAEGSKTHNKAVNYMLQMEDRDREMLRAGNKHMLDYYNEVQKEAMKRLVEKDVKEQVMNQDREKMLKERMVDKRIDLIR